MEIVLVIVLVGGALALGLGLNRWYLSKPRSFEVDGRTYTRHPDNRFTRADGSAIAGDELARVQQRWDERRQSNSDWNDRDYDYSSND